MINFKLNRTIHQWLSLIVGIQLLIWLVTGLYFNLMDTQKASGNALRTNVAHQVKTNPTSLYPISQLGGKPPLEINLMWILNHPYYHLVYHKGHHGYQKQSSALFDAQTGIKVSLTAKQIMQIAKASYTGNGKLSKPTLQQAPFDDYIQQQNSMWQVTAADELKTAIYLDGVTGKVIRHSNDDKRLKDLMMKLHFMDYSNSGGFNHWLIIIFAIATLLLSLTGAIWVVRNLKTRHKI